MVSITLSRSAPNNRFVNLSRTLIISIFTIWMALTLAFLALRVLPGDAISTQLSSVNASLTEIEARRAVLGLDKPLLLQYFSYLQEIARGEFGVSLFDGLPVIELILPRLLPSAELAFSAAVVSTILGITIGAAASTCENSIFRIFARLLTSLSLSIPIYWLASIALLFTTTGISKIWLRYWLPVFVLGIGGMGSISKIISSEINFVLQSDFVLVAQAKGLSRAQILKRHIFKIVLLPTVSVIALQLGWLMGGAVMTEVIFNRPGLGRLLFERTLNQDYPVVQAIVLITTVVFIIANSLAEMVFRFLDPRIRI